MIKEIAFTGTSVTDMKRARAFYEETLGLKPSEEIAGGKWIEYNVGNGRWAGMVNIASSACFQV